MTMVENQDVPVAYGPIIDDDGLNERGEREVVIAVMGITGAGKSYLINQITGQPVVVGDGLEGCKFSPKRIKRRGKVVP
jgi:Fe-S cluster assembly ATPase SufC